LIKIKPVSAQRKYGGDRRKCGFTAAKPLRKWQQYSSAGISQTYRNPHSTVTRVVPHRRAKIGRPIHRRPSDCGHGIRKALDFEQSLLQLASLCRDVGKRHDVASTLQLRRIHQSA